MTHQSRPFEKTMRDLESSLQVQHIATFGLITCVPDDNPQEVLSRYPDIDHLPVRADGTIVGVLSRHEAGQHPQATTVRECMEPFSEQYLVSAEQPLLPFLDVLIAPPHFRLVLSGAHIIGIVTRSDTFNLPVRLLGFALSMQLEAVLAEMITTRHPDEQKWMTGLPEDERKGLLKELKKLREFRDNPEAIEVATFDQKIRLATKYYSLGESFQHEANEVRYMRNDVAHGHNYAENQDYLELFVGRLKLAEQWIHELTQRYLDL